MGGPEGRGRPDGGGRAGGRGLPHPALRGCVLSAQARHGVSLPLLDGQSGGGGARPRATRWRVSLIARALPPTAAGAVCGASRLGGPVSLPRVPLPANARRPRIPRAPACPPRVTLACPALPRA